MIATKQKDTIKIGKDFVDAETGRYQSHGKIEINNASVSNWKSTFPIAETERLLRQMADSEGARVTSFQSQAI